MSRAVLAGKIFKRCISNLPPLHLGHFWVPFFSISNCILIFRMKMWFWMYTLHRRFSYTLHRRFTSYLLTFYTFSENSALKQIINSHFRFSALRHCYWTEQILLGFFIFSVISLGFLSDDFHASRGPLTFLCSSILLNSTTVLLFASGFLAESETNSD